MTWTDRKVEEIIAEILRAGVLLAAVVVLAGGLVYLVRHGSSPVNYRTFRGEPSELREVGGIVRYGLTGRGRGLIQLGLLLLIATPVIRVAFSVVAFAIEGDRMYVAFAGMVLVILLFSLFGYQSVTAAL
jgi:uncharacterized membrane protein